MSKEKITKEYDVVIVGGGASGTALLYALSLYTDIKRIALIEKYSEIGNVNTNARNNSQTLHIGEIETNYSPEKAAKVRPAAMMVKRYTDGLPLGERRKIIKSMQKMVLAVGEKEVSLLEKKFKDLQKVFPQLEQLGADGIFRVEPEVMRGRSAEEPVLALFNPEGHAVNFGELAKSLAKEALGFAGERAEVHLETEVLDIQKVTGGYRLVTDRSKIFSRAVVVDADAYSLLFAKKLGYGKEFSLIPIAGNFYFSPPKLRGKVYRVQEPRMPFAAIHGDADLTRSGETRWGPTARFSPVLEARKLGTALQFFRVSGFGRAKTWISFASILLEPIRFWYLFKNFCYEIPILGKALFLAQVRKIVPTLRLGDLSRAVGYGGMRLQRVNTQTRELLLGEGKIVGENIVFNMTPSPGASVCLYNSMCDAEQVVKFLPEYFFDRKAMVQKLCVGDMPEGREDLSPAQSYAS